MGKMPRMGPGAGAARSGVNKIARREMFTTEIILNNA